MAPEVTVAIIQILPSILAIGVVLILAVIFKKPLEQRIIPRLSGFKILGVEITLLKGQRFYGLTMSPSETANSLRSCSP